MGRPTMWCECQGKHVDRDDCDHCDFFGDFDDRDYEEPPLYPEGHLAALTPEGLIKERNRQSRIHDKAVDRCEEINSPTIETAAARHRLCAAELERRGLNPWADEPRERTSNQPAAQP